MRQIHEDEMADYQDQMAEERYAKRKRNLLDPWDIAYVEPVEFDTDDCPVCGGGGFSGLGTMYDDVCDDCGGTGKYIIGIKKNNDGGKDDV